MPHVRLPYSLIEHADVRSSAKRRVWCGEERIWCPSESCRGRKSCASIDLASSVPRYQVAGMGLLGADLKDRIPDGAGCQKVAQHCLRLRESSGPVDGDRRKSRLPRELAATPMLSLLVAPTAF